MRLRCVCDVFDGELCDFEGISRFRTCGISVLPEPQGNQMLRLQGYQTCADAAFGARGCFRALLRHFGGLLEKHLFLGRTLLLRLQGYQTLCWCSIWCSGVFPAPFETFRWPTRKAFVLRTDVAFVLPNVCWCRNVGSRASKRCVVQHLVLGVLNRTF